MIVLLVSHPSNHLGIVGAYLSLNKQWPSLTRMKLFDISNFAGNLAPFVFAMQSASCPNRVFESV
jgi:hypothetical protein